jgi:hypothetical protein
LVPIEARSKFSQSLAFIMPQRLDASDEFSRREDEIPAPEPPRREVAKLPVNATQLIGKHIRAMYARMVCEPIPDPLLELIRQLEKKGHTE